MGKFRSLRRVIVFLLVSYLNLCVGMSFMFTRFLWKL